MKKKIHFRRTTTAHYMAPVNSLTHIIFHLCIKSSVKYALNQKI